MIQQQLLENVDGKWIWMRENTTNGFSCQLFRSDFTLNEMPGRTEIMIAARSVFHLYVNGRHCYIGGKDNPTEANYVDTIDINYLVQVGCNKIAIQVFNSNAPLTGHKVCSGGLWAEIHVDGQCIDFTNENWRARIVDCYKQTGLSQRMGGPFVEYLDFRNYPRDWQTEDVPFPSKNSFRSIEKIELRSASSSGWQVPTLIKSVDKGKNALEMEDENDEVLESVDWTNFVANGTCSKARQSLWVDFKKRASACGPGVYVAETYIYVKEAAKKQVDCYCDRPYRLFLNDEEVGRQAIEVPPVMGVNRVRGEARLAMTEYVGTSLTMNFAQGWNRLVFAEDSSLMTSGMTLIWQDAEDGLYQCHVSDDINTPSGWMIRGPLRIPLSVLYPSIDFPDDESVFYDLAANPPCDASVIMKSCNFKVTKSIHENLQPKRQVAAHHYQVYDFGRVLLGHPQVELHGKSGDIVDIFCGEHYLDGCVLPYAKGHKNVTTVTLSGENDTWIAGFPQGFRYVMVLVRSASDDIEVLGVKAKVVGFQSRAAGTFSCSDETLNKIWSVGTATLNSTIHGTFIDAPGGEQAQYISDAMIQSWAAYHVRGDYALAGNSIECFVKSQYETGELNSVAPSGLFQVLPDYSLLWVVWLQRHIIYSGDTRLLNRIFDSVRKLLNYYDNLAIRSDGPLGDLTSVTGAYCFLDYDDAIDRSGISTGLNALYCRALVSASWLAEQLEQQDIADEWQHRAESVAAQIRELTWNEEYRLFADSYHDGLPSENYSWQSNVLALYGGLAEAKDYPAIWNRLFDKEPPYEKFCVPEYNNPFFKFYVLDVAFSLGKGPWALELIKHYWGGMIDAGATTWWELFDPALPQQAERIVSKCHGYGVAPNGFLITELIGIRPLEPGMSRVVFNPLITTDVTWAKAQIPTNYGRISVEWKRKDDGTLEVNISSNYPLEVVPMLSVADAEAAEFNINDNVTVLESEQ